MHFNPRSKLTRRAADEKSAQEIQPLLVCDLNADGLPEVVLGGANTVLWNQGDFRFERKNLVDEKFSLWHAGVIGDFTGDRILDIVGANGTGEGVILEGKGNGRFESPRRCWEPVALFPSAITAGDVDQDGDLDVWFTQYKPPYVQGQMPTPFYDAVDGRPSHLMLNVGGGRFEDATERSGLAAKRHRRTYSSSFVDLDDDHDLDLMVVSDFSGLDLYENDGHGKFREITDRWVDERHAFGMAHTFGDYDGDGRQDFYMVGMSSTTARRLDRLGLGRSDFPTYTAKRAPHDVRQSALPAKRFGLCEDGVE